MAEAALITLMLVSVKEQANGGNDVAALSEFNNLISQVRHYRIFRSAESEFRFPDIQMDGSQWKRLLSMKERNNKRKSQREFWERLHAVDSPVYHERKSMQRALCHWFYSDSLAHASVLHLASLEAAVASSNSNSLDGSINPEASLDEVEKKWLKTKTSAKLKSLNLGKGSFWVDAELGALEGGRPERVRKKTSAAKALKPAANNVCVRQK